MNFKERYKQDILSILKSIQYDVERGYDPIGSVGSLVIAMANFHGEIMKESEAK